jgi:hypothetical protein
LRVAVSLRSEKRSIWPSWSGRKLKNICLWLRKNLKSYKLTALKP